ncbi:MULTISPECIES: DUF6116 family protein [unclassified Lysobacter]|uniref:DUF6116 family protein n=1 Tax=unclassified Lysobacter TaxID=2635362 RepID=UPI001C24599F|nr:DUF6116 family protein [Lysobacter sp. MMG2]MBU8978136.1 hypothetical protein [Lysobacter sp. MMG2]
MASPITAPLLGYLSKLSFPRLFLVAAALFLVDLVVPDFIPLADELLLGLGTLLLASWKKRKDAPLPPPPVQR